MRRSIMVGLAVAVVAASVRAENVDTAAVSAGARWVAHVDASAFLQSKIGTLATGEMMNEKATAKLDFVRQAIGIDPLKDITSLTMYGSDYGDKSGIVVIRGSFATDKIETFLKAADGYQSQAYGSRTIHTWVNKEKGRPGYICFADRGLAVVGAEPEKIQAALDVIDGKRDRLAESSNLKKMLSSNSGFLSVAALKGETSAIGENPRAAVVKNIESMSLGLGEVAGKIKLNALLGVNSLENATQMEQVLNGMTALVALSTESDPALVELAKGLKVSREEGSIRVEFTGDSQAIFDYVKANRPKHGMRQYPGSAAQENEDAPAATR